MTDDDRPTIGQIARTISFAASFYRAHPHLLAATLLPGARHLVREAIDSEAAWHRLCAVLPPSEHPAAQAEIERLMNRPPAGMKRSDACVAVYRRWALGEGIICAGHAQDGDK